jgi:hypothetical protein
MRLHRRQQHDQSTPASGRTASDGSIYHATESILSGQLVPANEPLPADAKCFEDDPVAAMEAQRGVSRMRENLERTDRNARRACGLEGPLAKLKEQEQRLRRGLALADPAWSRKVRRRSLPPARPRRTASAGSHGRARRERRACLRSSSRSSDPPDEGEPPPPHPRRRGGAA